MAMATRLRWFLDRSGLPYEILPHPHSSSSLETARLVQVPAERLVKPVLLEDERGYVLAIVPASARVDLAHLRRQLQREFVLASEREIEDLFPDCDRGALPPVGLPYRIPTVYDDCLAELPDVYFEAGDHEDVVHMKASDFLQLLQGAAHWHFVAEAH